MIYEKIAYWLTAGSILGACYFCASIANQLAYKSNLLNALACLIVAGAFATVAMILSAAMERNENKKRACRLAERQTLSQTGVGTID